MIITKEQSAEMLEAAKPLIKWINDNCHPHVKVVVETNRAELVEGVSSVMTDEYVKD